MSKKSNQAIAFWTFRILGLIVVAILFLGLFLRATKKPAPAAGK